MKLSEAIRLGAMLRPQGFGGLTMSEDGTSCALRAGADAIGLALHHDSDYSPFYQQWPWIVNSPTWLPEGVKDIITPLDVCEAIWMLNDDALWTREQIADWVATIEPQDTPQAEAVDGKMAGSL